jgi:hypothetical protein
MGNIQTRGGGSDPVNLINAPVQNVGGSTLGSGLVGVTGEVVQLPGYESPRIAVETRSVNAAFMPVINL